jgi:hypothetical protein
MNLFLLGGARTFGTISIALAAVLFIIHKDLASLGCDIESPYPFKKKPICRQPAQMKPTLKGTATERVYLAQILGINNNPPLTVVFFMNQIEQLPGGAAIKISTDM